MYDIYQEIYIRSSEVTYNKKTEYAIKMSKSHLKGIIKFTKMYEKILKTNSNF